jgi:hypothetical protein
LAFDSESGYRKKAGIPKSLFLSPSFFAKSALTGNKVGMSETERAFVQSSDFSGNGYATI